MGSTLSNTNHAASPPEDWRTHAAWALRLVARLSEVKADRHARKQGLADGLATHFQCAVILNVSVKASGGVVREIERFTSPTVSSRTVVDASPDRIANGINLPNARRASVTLRRANGEPSFTDLDNDWLELVHAGCAFVYASPAIDAHRRLDDLSPREREALGHLMNGASEKEVAMLLGRSRHTVHSYVKRIYRTLGVRSRVELRSVLSQANQANHASDDIRGDQPVTTSDV